MNAYRFIVFLPGSAPTTDELRRFSAYADLLERHVAYGKRKQDTALAICCEAEPFERLRGLDPSFEELLTKWRVRGAEVVDSLPFSKAPELWKRLRPRDPAPSKPRPLLPDRPIENRPAEENRHHAAAAEGRMRVAVEDAAEQGRRYERLGAWLPYALAVLAGAGVLFVGAYLGARLADSPAERREETIRRVAEDAINERLDRRPSAEEVDPE